VAFALNDASVRATVLSAMRDSPVKEGKLAFNRFLTTSGGSELRRRMLSESEKTDEELSEMLGALPALEFYVPVKEHRESWQGSADVVVAIQLNERAVPVGFNLDGESLPMSIKTPPSRITLVLVPQEQPIPIGTVMRAECNPEVTECGFGGGGGGVPPTPSRAGIYMSYAEFNDLHEPWTKGEPEIEVMAIGPNPLSNTSRLAACSNEVGLGRRFYDQDHTQWYGDLDTDDQKDVLIVDSVQLAAIYNQYPSSTPEDERQVMVQWWEDDTERCFIYEDAYSNVDNYLGNILFGGLTAGIGIKCVIVGCPWGYAILMLQVGTGLFYFLDRLFAGNDDFIGMAVGAASWNAKTGSTTVVRTHAVTRDGTNLAGAANLNWRPTGYYAQ
jgi:hypothetical protein